MKVLVELLVIVLLLVSGWHQPFREHASRIFPNAPFATKAVALPSPMRPHVDYVGAQPRGPISPAPRNAPDNSWLWDKTPLDPH